MPFNYARFAFLAFILVAGLPAAPFSFASSITGHTFTVTVSEKFNTVAGSDFGVAGSPGVDVGV